MNASALPVRSFSLYECRSLFASQVFSLGLHSQQICIFLTMSSTSADSEMTFDSEGSEIYYMYIAEVGNIENDDSHLSTHRQRLFVNTQTKMRVDK